MLNYKKAIILIVVFAILIRLFLLYIAPVSMFADPVLRYLPNAEKVLHGNFSFNDVPLFIMFEAFWMLLFKGNMLWFAWKLTSFIFFIGILFLLPSLFKKLELKKNEKIIMLALLLFSTWSLLLSAVVLQDMMLTFFTLALFLSIEKYFERPSKKWIAVSILLSISMILTKMTGYFILAGFFLYILTKQSSIRRRIKFILYLGLGSSATLLWMLKNYITSGMLYVHSVNHPIYIHSFPEYLDYFMRFYHYFWEIPLPAKVELTGSILVLYNMYYITALIVTAILSLLIVFSLIKYGRRYKQYLLLMLPLSAFAFYWAFIIFWGPHDFGRYTFPLWIFLFLFPVKLISSIKRQGLRRLCYLVIVLFCMVSIVSAFGITSHISNIDNQILEVSKSLKEQGASGTFRANDEFTASALGFYLKKPVHFNSSGSTKDKSLVCEGKQIFTSKNYGVSELNSDYRVCRH